MPLDQGRSVWRSRSGCRWQRHARRRRLSWRTARAADRLTVAPAPATAALTLKRRSRAVAQPSSRTAATTRCRRSSESAFDISAGLPLRDRCAIAGCGHESGWQAAVGPSRRRFGRILQSEEWAVQRARYVTLETIAPMSDDPDLRGSARKEEVAFKTRQQVRWS